MPAINQSINQSNEAMMNSATYATGDATAVACCCMQPYLKENEFLDVCNCTRLCSQVTMIGQSETVVVVF
jgi:hypothetical protein